MLKGKTVVGGGLTNSCEKKRSKRQRRRGKIYVLFVCFGFFFYLLAFWLQSTWDLNFPLGIELTLPVLEGKVLTMDHQGSPKAFIFETGFYLFRKHRQNPICPRPGRTIQYRPCDLCHS